MKGNKDFTGISIPPSHGCGEFCKRDLLRLVSRQAGIVLRVGSGSRHFRRQFVASMVIATFTFWPVTRGCGWSRTVITLYPFRYSSPPNAKSSPGLVKPGSPLSSTGNCALCSPFYPTGITITDCIFSCHKNTFCTLSIAW